MINGVLKVYEKEVISASNLRSLEMPYAASGNDLSVSIFFFQVQSVMKFINMVADKCWNWLLEEI